MTDSTDNATLLQRLDRLEQHERRTQIMISILAGLVLILGVVLPLTRGTVTARTFVLESGGKVRATLSTSSDGSPALVLNDDHGTLRAALRVSGNGVPALLFGDPQGNVRAVMGLPSDGTPSMVLLNQGGKVSYMAP